MASSDKGKEGPEKRPGSVVNMFLPSKPVVDGQEYLGKAWYIVSVLGIERLYLCNKLYIFFN